MSGFSLKSTTTYKRVRLLSVKKNCCERWRLYSRKKEEICVPVMCFAGHCVCWTDAVRGEKEGGRKKERENDVKADRKFLKPYREKNPKWCVCLLRLEPSSRPAASQVDVGGGTWGKNTKPYWIKHCDIWGRNTHTGLEKSVSISK